MNLRSPRRVLVVVSLLAMTTGSLQLAASAVDDSSEVTSGRHLVRSDRVPNTDDLTWTVPPELTNATLRIPDSTRYLLPDTEAHRTLGAPGEPAWLSGTYGDNAKAPALILGFAGRSADDPDVAFELAEVVAPEGGHYQAYQLPELNSPADGTLPPSPSRNGTKFVTTMGTGVDAAGEPQPRVSQNTGTAPATLGRADYVHRFTVPGMYCITFTGSQHLHGVEQRSQMQPLTLRFAVGDSVSADAPCGTAGDDPGENPDPDPGENPDPDPGENPDPDPGENPDPDPGENPDPDPSDVYVMRAGHGDVVAPRIVGQGPDRRLELAAKIDGQGMLDYADVVIHQNDKVKTVVPDDERYVFMGAPGQEVWNSPQALGDRSIRDFSWIGSSTEDPALVANGSTVDMTIEQIVGPDGQQAPGALRIWTGTYQGPKSVLVNSEIGLSGPGTPALLSSYTGSNHSHYNWTFTEAGVYCLAVSAQTEIDGDLQVVRDWLTLTVGDQTNADQVTPCARTLPPPTEPEIQPTALVGGAAPHVIKAQQYVSLHPTEDAGITISDGDPSRNRATQFTSADDSILHVTNVGIYSSGWRLPVIRTDTYGLSSARGPVSWVISDVEGPGSLTYLQQPWSSGATYPLRPRSATANVTQWNITSAGKYCIDTTYSTQDGYLETATLTLVVDGPVDPTNPDSLVWKASEHGALDQSCASGGTPQDPKDNITDPDPGPDPTEPVWKVPNGTVNDHGATIINNGHIDIASLLSDGGLDTSVKDSATSGEVVWRDPAKSVLQIVPDAEDRVPDDPRLSFLGAAGTPVWIAPETEQAGVLWAGWSTEHLPESATAGGVEWTLTDADGPGSVAVYTSVPNGFGAVDVRFNTADGITGADSFEIGKRIHAHGTWAFGAEGVYCLDFTRSATLAEDNRAVDDEFTLAVVVGRADPRSVDPADCVGTGSPDPGDPDEVAPAVTSHPDDVMVRAGQDAVFTAAASGEPVPSVRWESRIGDGDWAVVAGATESSLRLQNVTEDLSGMRVRAVFTNGAGSVTTDTGRLTVTTTSGPGPGSAVTTKVAAATVRQVYGKAARVDVRVSSAASGMVLVTAGAQTAIGVAIDGRATVQIPAKALAPGKRRISIAYLGSPGEHRASIGTATVMVSKAKPVVKTKAPKKVMRGKVVAITVTVKASGVRPGGKVRVKIAGVKAKKVSVNWNGKATVKVQLGRKATPGTRKVRVTYRGDAQVAKAKAKTTKIRITR